MYANRQTGARWQVKHVAVTEKLFGAALVENGARIDLAGHLECHAGRDVGLDQAGDHVHRRPLGGEDQVNTGCPGLLRDTRDQFFDLLADDHHHVGELVHHHHDGRQLLQQWRFVFHALAAVQRVGQRRAGLLRFLHLAVEASQVAHAHGRHQLVAALHLGDAPTQRVGRFLHVGDDRAKQVRNAFVDGQFQHLRVDHDQSRIVRRGLEQDRQDHRVDTHRLTRAGRTRHQQVRHLGQVGDHWFAADIVAQGDGHR